MRKNCHKRKKETSKKKNKTKQNKLNDTQEERIYLQYLLYQLMSTYIVALISENGVFSFSSHDIMVQYFAVFFFFFSFFLNSKLGNNLVWSCQYQSLHTVDHLTTICLICLILFQDCAFSKLQSNSALRVSFQGNMRVYGNNKCNRWYFKFIGNECS